MRQNKRVFAKLFLAVFIIAAIFPSLALAQSSSTNYKVEESYFGSGGGTGSSTNFQARQSAGSLGVGDSSSANYRSVSGFDTPNAPFLEVYVSGAVVELGTLDDTTPSFGSAQAGACNCSFSVRSYLSSDYVVVTASQPPTSENNDVLQNKAVQGSPSTNSSIEEFGINLVDNTTPDIGANPINQPDNTFADGKAETGYDIPDQYKYVQGDIIARSPATAGNQGVGLTDFTISYEAKIKSITKAGYYTMKHDIIVTPTF